MSKECKRCGREYFKRDRDSAAQWAARRFCCRKCHRAPLEERLWSNIERGSDQECWPWLGHVSSTGHGGIRDGRRERGAHRVAYEQLRGPLSSSLILHHECGNKLCCNPAHMTPMPQGEHIRLHDAGGYQRTRTHCKNGHEFHDANTFLRNGVRLCRACAREATARHRRRLRER